MLRQIIGSVLLLIIIVLTFSYIAPPQVKAQWNQIAAPKGLPQLAGAGVPVLGTTSLEPCQSKDYWATPLAQWAVPPGCYGAIYAPNQANYPARPDWGWCNWWVEELHPSLPGDQALQLPRHATPVVGAVAWLAAGEQGASDAGHYAEVVALNPDGYWLLVSEMNDNWRGAGFGLVNYRYIHVSPNAWFLY
jgi:hypothetical protein